MTFFVHKTTSRLARTLKIGTGKIFCTRNPKITFKTSKNLLLLSYCTSLPKFECGTTKLQKSMWHYWKMKIFFFCVFYTVWTFSHPKMKSCSFSVSSQFNFKNGHFFKPSNRQNGNFSNDKELIIQMIFMASCIEEIYLKVLDK